MSITGTFNVLSDAEGMPWERNREGNSLQVWPPLASSMVLTLVN